MGALDSDILKVVAHDLRNPLTCIESYVDLLLQGSLAVEDKEKALMRIQSCARWANHIVSDLTDAGAVEKGKLSLRRELVSIEEIVRQTVEDFKVMSAAKELKLEMKVNARSSQGYADASRLRQVLNNLLVNALKHVMVGGSILVRVDEAATEMAVTVQDNGDGIDPSHQPRVFDKFYQAGKDGRGSLGLGLYISRSIVELHGGRIWVASDGVGKGAAFSFTIPKFQPEKAYGAYREFRDQSTPLPVRRVAPVGVTEHPVARIWNMLSRLVGSGSGSGRKTPAIS
ncbi:MAG: HAMP domain-containing histidine kinase [Proteobacteria bacterium]|nr:HAMP domain-containing histidine kinase [Pseudomonadota bacterium]